MNKDRQKHLIGLCTEHFFTHPSWESCLELLEMYIDDLSDVDTVITTGKSNDEIATELRARQITKQRIKRFIEDTLTLKKIKETVPKSTRKFK